MKTKKLVATLDGLMQAMNRLDTREMMADALKDGGKGDDVGSRLFESAVENMDCMALGYISSLIDAGDIAQGEEVGDADEYARDAMVRTVEARINIVMLTTLSRLGETLKSMGGD